MQIFDGLRCSAWVVLALVVGASSHAAERAMEREGALVFGGTGRLGAEVVKYLEAEGVQVTVFARPTSKRERLAGVDVDFVTGDVLNSDDVMAAFESRPFKIAVDALSRGSAPPEFYVTSLDYISEAAKATGVEQVILHGSVGAGESRAVYPESRWPQMSAVLLAKDEGEKILMASGVNYTIIRNAILLGAELAPSGNAELTPDQTAFGPITRQDLGVFTAQCAGNQDCYNVIYHAVDMTLETPRFER